MGALMLSMVALSSGALAAAPPPDATRLSLSTNLLYSLSDTFKPTFSPEEQILSLGGHGRGFRVGRVFGERGELGARMAWVSDEGWGSTDFAVYYDLNLRVGDPLALAPGLAETVAGTAARKRIVVPELKIGRGSALRL